MNSGCRFVNLIAAAAVLHSAQTPAVAFEIKIPNPLGIALEALGVKTYKLTPAYQKFVAPYIRNADAYDRMMNDYGSGKRVSEKAAIRLIIMLGILKKHPEWLNAQALEKIAQYYPTKERKTYDQNYDKRYAALDEPLLRVADDNGRISTFIQYAQAGVAVPPNPMLLQSLQAATASIPLVLNLPAAGATAATVIAAVVIFGLDWDTIAKYFTPEAQQQIASQDPKVCAEADGGCTRKLAPVIGSTGKGNQGKPCITVTGQVVPVGTIAYRPLDTPVPGRIQHGIAGPHYNIYRANQNPENGKCFWQSIGAVEASKLPAGAIPIQPFV